MSQFFDFQDGGSAPSWILNILNFNGQQVNVHHHAKAYGDRQIFC